MGKDNGHGVRKFLAGAAIGVGLGVLLAPKSGKETRKDLKNKFDELTEKVKEINVDDVKESIEAKIFEIRNDLADLDKEKALELAKEKAEQIKVKLDLLVAETKEKATPVIQKTVNDLRSKTISVLKDTIKKLEKEEERKNNNKKKDIKRN